MTLAATAAAFLLAPAVAAGHESHGSDYVLPTPPTSGAKALTACEPEYPAPAAYPGQGFAILTVWNAACGVAQLRPSSQYTVRLVSNGQGDVETMRSSTVRAAAQVASTTGVQISVAPGTVPDTAGDRAPVPGEILLSVDNTSPCDGGPTDWAGCGTMNQFVGWRQNDTEAHWSAGRIWVRPYTQTEPLLERDHLVAHELGHTLGLAHFADLHQGEIQVMHGAGNWSAKDFRAGDRNGLAHVTNAPPIATTLAATGVSGDLATLRGTVNPNGYATTYRFEWGTGTNYGNAVPVPDAAVGSGTSAVNVSQAITGLRSHTTYHYRLVATSQKGTRYGADQTFTTAALDDRPAVVNGFNGVGRSTFVTNRWGSIRVTTQLPSGQSSWTTIGAGATSAPAAVRRADGTVDVFVLWNDGSVRHKSVNPNGVESGWNATGLSGVSAPAAAIRRGPNGSVGSVIDLVVRGSGNDVLVNSFDIARGTWGGAYSIGGTFRSAPAVMSYFDGGVHVYARGTDDAIHQKYWDPTERRWIGWHWLGGVATSSPAVTSWYDGNIEIGVRGTDGAFYHKGWAPDPEDPDQGEWGAWIRHDVQIDSAPTLSTERPGQLVVTARESNAIRRRIYDNDAWGSWTSLGDPEAPDEFLSQVAVVEAVDGSGKTSMYVRDGDGLIRTSTTDGLFQTPWRALSGRVSSAPAAVQRRDGTTDVFALVNGAVLQKTVSPAGVESAWRSIGLSGASAPAAAMRRGPNGTVGWVIDVVVRGSGNDIVLTSLDTETGRQWGPYSMGGSFRSAPTIMSYFEGGIHVHARGTDDAVHQKFWIPEREDWSPWYWLGGTTGATPTATSWYGGNIEIGVLGSDSAFHHKGWNPTGGTDRRGAWGDWIRHDVHLDSPPTLSSARPGQLKVFGRQGVYVIRRVYDSNAWGSWIWLNNPSLRLINP